jgi:hypothetical protein
MFQEVLSRIFSQDWVILSHISLVTGTGIILGTALFIVVPVGI